VHGSKIQKSNSEAQQIVNPVFPPARQLVPKKYVYASNRPMLESEYETPNEAKYPVISQKSKLGKNFKIFTFNKI
jgi:hypothetical protein